MQFAKVFDVDGHQVLCLLHPRDEDGLPELKMVTYVGTTCVMLGNGLIPPGAHIHDPQAVLAQTRALFEGFGQKEAEQALRAARALIADAAREQAAAALAAASASSAAALAGTPDPTPAPNDPDFGVPIVSAAVH